MLLYDSAVMDANRLLPAVEALSGAALGTSSWTDALARLGDAVRADHLFLQAQAATPFFAAARIDERDLARSMAIQHEAERSIPGFDTVADGCIVIRSSLIPDREYVRTFHYNELTRPLGGFHGLVAGVRAPAQGSSLILCRSQRRDDFGPGDAAVVNALLPHIAMAIDFHGRVTRAGQAVRAFESLIEGIGEAAVICDRSMRPLFANGAAQRLLAESDGLAVGCAGLFGTTLQDTQRLRAACAAAETHGLARLRLSRRSGRPPLMLRIVSASKLALGSASPGSLAVFVGEPDAAPPIDREAIADAFGLTRREAEIAALLADGASPAAIAGKLDLGVASVRVYLTRIFSKTGARSQAALVATIRGFV
jgi:DNA-binding CsgD family transcriptional regulator/PAS domain-containing protein